MKNYIEPQVGDIATLNNGCYGGYRRIELVEYWSSKCKWEVEIKGSGKRIFVYEDEFDLD